MEQTLIQQERRGEVVFGHVNTLTVDSNGYSLVVDYQTVPGTLQTMSRQESRSTWGAVRRLEITDRMICFHLVAGEFLFVPRHTFGSDHACQRWIDMVQGLRAAGPPSLLPSNSQIGIKAPQYGIEE